MDEDSIQKELQFFFPNATRDDWKKIAEQETNGKDPFEVLSWHGKDDIKFLPYYDALHAAHLRNPSQYTPAATGQTPNHWLNVPAIGVSDESEANKLAQLQLSRGADGVFFYLDQDAFSDVNQLFSGIETSSSNFLFRIHNDQHFQKIFAAESETAEILHQINGALFWESVPKTSKLSGYFKRWKNFRALGVMTSGSSPTEQIASALFHGVHAYERFDVTSSPLDVFHSISFSVSADVSFLETVAKIKALRQLWLQVARAYGHNDYKLEDVYIHARSDAATEGNYAPRQDMLKAAFASMAAVAGGCDSLTIEGDNSVLFQRWATNVSHILREESFFGRTVNPLTGAYAVEVMSDEIAKKAWELFQSKMTVT